MTESYLHRSIDQIRKKRYNKDKYFVKRYPPNEESSQWYIYSAPSASDNNDSGPQWGDNALIVLRRTGSAKYRTIGEVPFKDPEFASKWRDVLCRCCITVDALNLQDAEDISESTSVPCATCGEPSPDGDYLCANCREKEDQTS